MVRLRRIDPGDGLILKQARLGALEESPEAFSSTLAAEASRIDSEWADRATAGSSGTSRITVFAEADHGVVGLVGGYRKLNAASTVELVSMWVSPTARRQGIGLALAQAVVDWARETGAREVAVGVAEGNVAAKHLYEAIGFASTGAAAPVPARPTLVELRMVMPLE